MPSSGARHLTGDGGEVFLLANTLSLFVVLFSKPLGGWLSDQRGPPQADDGRSPSSPWRSSTSRCTRCCSARHALFVGGQLLMAVPLGMALGLQGAMLVEIFPLRTRVTSMSLAYSMTLALAGGTAPLVADLADRHVRAAAGAGLLHHAVRRDWPRPDGHDEGDQRAQPGRLEVLRYRGSVSGSNVTPTSVLASRSACSCR